MIHITIIPLKHTLCPSLCVIQKIYTLANVKPYEDSLHDIHILPIKTNNNENHVVSPNLSMVIGMVKISFVFFKLQTFLSNIYTDSSNSLVL